MRAAFAAALLVAALVVAGFQPGAARANGVPQLVKLSYLDGVSNWGPKDAEGVLQFSFAEAFARVEVKNLPPQDGLTYEGWLFAPDGSALAVGPIATAPSGVGTAESKLEGLDRYDYNLFVVAARPAAAGPGDPPSQKSIAGRFSIESTTPEAGAGGDTRPATLPETGEPAPGLPWGRILATAGVALGAAIILFGRKLRPGRTGGSA